MASMDGRKKWNESSGPIHPPKTQGLERWLDNYHLSRLERDRYFDDLIPRARTPRSAEALSVRR